MKENRATWSVFIADPEPDTLYELGLVTQACGYQPKLFFNGKHLLAALRKHIPSLLIVDLMLPDMDGFELCHAVRSQLHYRHLPILCTSALSWGSMDLDSLLGRRFQARFLTKNSLAGNFVAKIREILGEAKARPTRSVLENFIDEEIQNPGPDQEDQQRRKNHRQMFKNLAVQPAKKAAASVNAQHVVRFENLGELVGEFAENISKGGLFVHSEDPPALDEEINLKLMIPCLERSIEIRAKVVHRISRAEAAEYGVLAGFGTEFIDLTPAHRAQIEKLVSDARNYQSMPVPGDDPDTTWVVLIGAPILSIVGRPTFLLREDVKILEFPDLSIAEDFLSQQRVDLVIVGEKALEWGDPAACLQKLNLLLRPDTERMIMIRPKNIKARQPRPERCLDSSLSMDQLLDQLRHRLGVHDRQQLRVPCEATLTLSADQQEFPARLIDVSGSGMLIASEHPVGMGSEINIEFQLPQCSDINCRALVVRQYPDPQSGKQFSGLMFSGFTDHAETEIQQFVQGHTHFKEFKRWGKKSFNHWP